MRESDQNNLREMSTMDLYLALQVCNPMLLKSYDPKIRKFKRIWRIKHKQTMEVNLKIRVHCF